MTKQEENEHVRITILVSPDLDKRLTEYVEEIDSDISKFIRRLITDKLIEEGKIGPQDKLHRL